MRRLPRHLVMLTCLLLLPLTARGQVLVSTDGQSDPRDTGWTYRGHTREMPSWGPDAQTDNRCLHAASGGQYDGWQSPDFPTTPGAYYQVSFRAKATGQSFAAALWCNADRDEMRSDQYCGISASDDWQPYTFCFRAREGSRSGRVRFRGDSGNLLHVDDVSVAAVTDEQVLAWSDALYSALPPLTYAAPAGRGQRIPRAMQALRDGKPLRVVLLGDSIVNDLDNSAWEVLLRRAYPTAQIAIVTSIEGGTGCETYRKEGMVKRYVLDHKPDLVILGGISNKSAESVHDVVRQIRAASDTEILLLTGAFGMRYKPPTAPDWTPAIDPQGKDYRSQLLRIALEEQCELLDLQGALDAYFRDTKLDPATCMRDVVHPNDRGRALMGRVLVRYLSPSSAPPEANLDAASEKIPGENP